MFSNLRKVLCCGLLAALALMPLGLSHLSAAPQTAQPSFNVEQAHWRGGWGGRWGGGWGGRGWGVYAYPGYGYYGYGYGYPYSYNYYPYYGYGYYS